jgi:hypothetical protein
MTAALSERLPAAGAAAATPWHDATAPGFPAAETASLSAPVRVRTGHSYHVYFSIALGQRNARFVERAMTPLARYLSWFPWADAVTFTPEPGFDALHTWNAVPLLTRRPFVTTFEDFMPRTPDDRRIGWIEPCAGVC